MTKEKKVIYTSSNTYSTLNTLTKDTKNIWFVFHGLGYLSKYFIHYFSHLNPDENYIIAPQAPSKYYLGKNFKHVGASWLTKENTVAETKNVLAYIDEVYKNEINGHSSNLIILGYSQGVSIATRWLASRKINCKHLLLHSGGIPKELSPNNFKFLNKETKVTYLYGNKDPYITEARKTEEQLIGTRLFGEQLQILQFKGVHEVDKNYILKIAKE